MWRILLLLLIIVILYLGLQYSERVEEGFVASAEIPTMKTCPFNTTTFITKGGEQQCCEGTVNGKTCNGNVLCSLTEPKKDGPPGCGAYIKKLFDDRATRFCPRAMNRYFDNNKGSRGCTAGFRTPDWSAPVARTDKQCIIYKTEQDDLKNGNSCYIQKKLENIKCPTGDSTKQYVGGLPGCAFKDTKNIPRFCVDKQSWLQQQEKVYGRRRQNTAPRIINRGRKIEKFYDLKAAQDYVRNGGRDFMTVQNLLKAPAAPVKAPAPAAPPKPVAAPPAKKVSPPPPKPKVYTLEEEANRGIWICDVAKKYYIDRSITQNDIIWEPSSEPSPRRPSPPPRRPSPPPRRASPPPRRASPPPRRASPPPRRNLKNKK